MKFEKVVKGKKAEDRIEVPGFQDENGNPFVVLAVPITGLEYESACASARARAVEKGVPNPGIGDPIYDMALMAFVLAVGCVDPDSDPNNRKHSFKDAIQILTDMHPETIVYLHERHELHQADCSPNVYKFDNGDAGLFEAVREVAGPDGRATFMRWSPSMRLNCSLSMARNLVALWDSQKLKSTLGSTSESDVKSDETESAPLSKPSENDADSTETAKAE